MNFENLALSLRAISQKCLDGERITAEEALELYDKMPTDWLGHLADIVNERKNEGVVFYNINRHINPTNVCVKSCKFCAFSRKPGEEGAYEYSLEEITQRTHQAAEQGATEVHVVGGLHPRWSFDYFLKMLRAIKEAEPQIHIKAFTAVEIDWLAAKARMSISQTLQTLREAGLGSMPGGGAEIFHPEVREKICDTKTDAQRWLMIHEEAHKIGLKTNATMLYGHIENSFHRIDHMDRLRQLQDKTRGFQVFIPLAFQPFENEMGIDTYTRSDLDLRTIAIARLFLDNFTHIKAYWIMLGQDTAQTALQFGANDLDGTVAEEKISRMAGGQSGMAMTRSEIKNLILRAGRIPIERNTLYQSVNSSEWDARREVFHLRPRPLLESGKHLPFTSPEAMSDFLKSSTLPEVLHLCPEEIFSTDDRRGSRDWISRSVESYQQGKSVAEYWEQATRDNRPLALVAKELAKSGVRCVEGKNPASELGLTSSEWIDGHREFHLAGVKTAAKLELSAPMLSKGSPFWDVFAQRLDLFENCRMRLKVFPRFG